MGGDKKTAKLRVLVVDDEANIRKTLCYCPEAEGHSTTAVSNPTDAVNEAKRLSCDGMEDNVP